MADEPTVSAENEAPVPIPESSTTPATENVQTTAPESSQVSIPEPVTTPVDLPEFTLDLSETPTRTEAPAQAISEEDVAKYLATKNHDDLKHIPAYNAQVQRAIQRHRDEVQKAQAANYELAQWDEWFRKLPPQQLLAARDNPQYDDMYIKVRNWRNQGSPSGNLNREAIAGDMLKGMQDYFKSDDRFKTVVSNWDDMVQETDLGAFVTNVIKEGMKTREKEIVKAAETKSKAYINDFLAKYHMSLPTPETQRTAPGSSGGGLTYEAYINATPEQVSKLDHSEIDRVLAEHRSKR